MKPKIGLLIVGFMMILAILEEINWLDIPFWVYVITALGYWILDIIGVNERSIFK